MTDYNAHKIPIVSGINDVPTAPDEDGSGEGCNGAYYIDKFHDALDAIALDIDTKFDIPAGTTVQYIRGDGTLATLPSGSSANGILNGTTEFVIPLANKQIEVKISNEPYGFMSAYNNLNEGSIVLGVSAGSYAKDNATSFTGLSDTVALGNYVLENAVESEASVCIGYNVGRQLIWQGSNVLIGFRTLQTASYAQASVGIGDFAFSNGIEVDNSVAIGSGALSNATFPIEMVSVGYGSATYTTTGQNGTSLGAFSLRFNTTGSRNTALGMCSLLKTVTGNNNTGVGQSSGSSLFSGANNTYLGAYAGAPVGVDGQAPSGRIFVTGTYTHNNVTLVGYNAQASAATISNEITLGDANVATLRSAVTSITSLSDARDKTNVQPLTLGLNFINTLNPVTYQWDKREWYEGEKDGSKTAPELNAGFLAQDLQAAQSEFNADYLKLVYDSNPDKLEATPGNLLFVAIKAMQEMSAKIEVLTDRINLLENSNA